MYMGDYRNKPSRICYFVYLLDDPTVILGEGWFKKNKSCSADTQLFKFSSNADALFYSHLSTNMYILHGRVRCHELLISILPFDKITV